MALQAGVSTVKVLILLGAGLTGSFLVNNGNLSDFISDISKVISKHLDSGDVSGKVSDKTAELYKQISKIRQEMVELATSKNITVVNGSPNVAGGNVASMAMPVVVFGAAGYGYFRWRGWSLGDFMYVTKRHMSNAITEVSKQFDQVSAALSATRRHLTSRIDGVSKALEDSAQVQDVIKNQVLDIRNDVAKCGGDVQAVQHIVEGLELKICEVQTKQDFAKRGILLLCEYVQGIENGRSEKLELPQIPRPQLQLPPSGGLKELQAISEKLEKGTSTSSSSSNSNASSSRTLRPTLSIDFKRPFATR